MFKLHVSFEKYGRDQNAHKHYYGN